MIFGQGHFFVYFTSPFSVHIDGRPSLSPFFQNSEKRKSFIPPQKHWKALLLRWTFYGLLFRYDCMTV
jgi:hypothetical protein